MKLKYYSLLFSFLILGACTKTELNAPDFDVTVESATYKVGERVKFNFSGDADRITFYSGEVYNDYAYKDGRTLTSDGLNLSFTTSVYLGTQKNQLSVWVSTDFNGIYEINDIHAATWIDITPGTYATTTVQTPWGPKNLQEYVVEGKPIYIGFRYITLPQGANGGYRKWTIREFLLESNTNLGIQTVADLPGAEFVLAHEGPFEPKRSSTTALNVVLAGNTTPANLESRTEDWAITKAIPVGNVDLGADKATPIKSFKDLRVSDYTHVYTEPGTYMATFIAFNSNIYGAEKVVRQIKITITE